MIGHKVLTVTSRDCLIQVLNLTSRITGGLLTANGLLRKKNKQVNKYTFFVLSVRPQRK